MSHIVIVGCGAAGLMAARTLLEKNHTVTVLEARDRIGGRIHTLLTKFSRPVEAGAEFIHGKQPLTLSILKQAGGENILLTGKHYTLSDNEIEQGDLLDDQWKAFSRALKKLKTDTDLATFLKKNFGGEEFKDFRQSIKGFAEGFDVADISRASTLALGEEWLNNDEAHQYHIHGGYQTLVNYLEKKISAAGGDILLSSPVKEIQWTPGNVKVITKSDTILEGDKVIVTVPLGVLQRGDISFSPPLPQQQKAFQNIGFGGVIKFLFEFKEAFWEKPGGRSFKNVSFIFSDAEVPTWWTQLPDKTPLLTGWLGGPRTVAIAHDVEMLYDRAIQSMAYIFKCKKEDIQSQVIHWHIADWVKDPYSCGAYSYATLETGRAKNLLSTPVLDTLYFSGEGLHEGNATGTVEAALMNGKEVAERIG